MADTTYVLKKITQLQSAPSTLSDAYILLASSGTNYKMKIADLKGSISSNLVTTSNLSTTLNDYVKKDDSITSEQVQASINNSISGITEQLENINGGTLDTIDNYSNIISFLDGYKDDDKLSTIISNLLTQIDDTKLTLGISYDIIDD